MELLIEIFQFTLSCLFTISNKECKAIEREKMPSVLVSTDGSKTALEGSIRLSMDGAFQEHSFRL
jgi:hypothetical protein